MLRPIAQHVAARVVIPVTAGQNILLPVPVHIAKAQAKRLRVLGRHLLVGPAVQRTGRVQSIFPQAHRRIARPVGAKDVIIAVAANIGHDAIVQAAGVHQLLFPGCARAVQVVHDHDFIVHRGVHLSQHHVHFAVQVHVGGLESMGSFHHGQDGVSGPGAGGIAVIGRPPIDVGGVFGAGEQHVHTAVLVDVGDQGFEVGIGRADVVGGPVGGVAGSVAARVAHPLAMHHQIDVAVAVDVAAGHAFVAGVDVGEFHFGPFVGSQLEEDHNGRIAPRRHIQQAVVVEVGDVYVFAPTADGADGVPDPGRAIKRIAGRPWVLKPDQVIGAVAIGNHDVQVAIAIHVAETAVGGKFVVGGGDDCFLPVGVMVPV